MMKRPDTKRFTIDAVHVALNLYKALGFIYAEDDDVICLTDNEHLVGSETIWAIQNGISMVNYH